MNLLDLLDPRLQSATPTFAGSPHPNIPMAPGAPADPMQAPQQPAKPPGLLERLQQSLLPTPAGFGGLLTPDELKQARGQSTTDMLLHMFANAWGQGGHNAPAFGQALLGGVNAGRSSFENMVQGAVQARMFGQQQAKAQKLEAQRQHIFEQYAPAPHESSDQVGERIKQLFSEFVRLGDTEMVGKLAQVVPALIKEHGEPKLDTLDTGGEKVDRLVYPDGRIVVVGKTPKSPAPKTPAEVDAGRRFAADQKNKILDDYARDTKDFHQVMAGWDVLQGATKDLTLATPFAITDAYARIMNPGAIVRPTTMEMIDNMGSVGQRMRKYWEHNANGALPPDILNDFKRTLYNVVKLHHDQYKQIREKAILRAKESGTDVEPIMQNYDLQDPFAAPNAAPAPGAKPGDAIRKKLGSIR